MYEDPKMMKWRKQVTDYIKDNYDGRYFDGAVSSIAETIYNELKDSEDDE